MSNDTNEEKKSVFCKKKMASGHKCGKSVSKGEYCGRHWQSFTPPPETSTWEERFDKEFVYKMTNDDHDAVAHYNEESKEFEFWNDYKIINFITQVREEAKREVLEGVIEKILEARGEDTLEDVRVYDMGIDDAIEMVKRYAQLEGITISDNEKK